MLQDYVTAYMAAMDANDKNEMVRIERELSMLGMDKYTLQIIVGEEKKA